jgi:hypothetical protein
MVVYHLNIFIGTVLCVPHVITNVTVALMFEYFVSPTRVELVSLSVTF